MLGVRARIASLPLLLALAPGAAGAAVTIERVASLKLPNSVFITNVIGYVDNSTLREYAILGDDRDKVYIVDVTTPEDPRLVAQIGSIPGFDLKTWSTYLYTCDGDAGGFDSRIVNLQDPEAPVVLPRGFQSAHTVQTAGGLLFAEYPGLRIFDLADPESPALVFESGGQGHDSTPRGTRLYDFHGQDGTVIWDISNPAAPVTLGSITDPAIVFHHSGDVTADGNTLYLCDELMTEAGADISIWDIANPASPVRVGSIADPDATVHNIYVVGTLAYVAYYSAGFKVFDLTNPAAPVLAGHYDTSRRTGDGFVGAIGAYAFSPSGDIFVSDTENGLFIFRVTPATAASAAAGAFVLGQNAPNPFNPDTRIPFDLAGAGRVSLVVYDVAGRRVRNLVDGVLPAGMHEAAWDGRDGAGSPVASGVYFYRMTSATRTETRRMVLVK